MGRPPGFEREQALHKALEVFWSHGYDAVSMSDLQRALGIGRQSLYNTFGDKDRIFVEALEAYVRASEAALAEAFGPDADLESLRAHLLRTVERLTEGEPRRGCLVMNTTVARSAHDPMIAEVTARSLRSTQEAYRRALTHAQQMGQISATADVEALAAVVTSQTAGLAVLARGGASVGELRRVVDATLALLEG